MPKRLSVFIIVVISFLDTLGMGMIYPIFASLLFDREASPLPVETGGMVRGMWMAILIALQSVVQFFYSPILGSLSDQKGRKPILLLAMGSGLVGYIFALLGLYFHSLILMIPFGIFIGMSMATITVIQATLVDMSLPGEKPRYFSFYNTAWGAGFALGPYLGGLLSDSTHISWFGYSTPFWFCLFFIGINLLLVANLWPETRKVISRAPIDLLRGVRQVKWAFGHPRLRWMFLSFFCFIFGWNYFIEFSSVTLKEVFNFTPLHIGHFLGYLGLIYALVSLGVSTWISRHVSKKALLIFSMLASGAFLLSFLGIKDPSFFWVFIPIFSFLTALFFPVAATFVSNNASEDAQGEILGIYDAVYSASIAVSPLISGGLVGLYPLLPIHLSGWAMIAGAVIFSLSLLRARISSQKKPSEG